MLKERKNKAQEVTEKADLGAGNYGDAVRSITSMIENGEETDRHVLMLGGKIVKGQLGVIDACILRGEIGTISGLLMETARIDPEFAKIIATCGMVLAGTSKEIQEHLNQVANEIAAQKASIDSPVEKE